ncbi:hypothetical protein NPIL_667071, partial [Nephila pilipes]
CIFDIAKGDDITPRQVERSNRPCCMASALVAPMIKEHLRLKVVPMPFYFMKIPLISTAGLLP